MRTGPMSEIRSDLRVRGIARVRVDSSKTFGSDSLIRSDYEHWIRASIFILYRCTQESKAI